MGAQIHRKPASVRRRPKSRPCTHTRARRGEAFDRRTIGPRKKALQELPHTNTRTYETLFIVLSTDNDVDKCVLLPLKTPNGAVTISLDDTPFFRARMATNLDSLCHHHVCLLVQWGVPLSAGSSLASENPFLSWARFGLYLASTHSSFSLSLSPPLSLLLSLFSESSALAA